MRNFVIVILVGICFCKLNAHTDSGFNKNWMFTLSDSASYAYESYSLGSNWSNVKIPHDWSIDLPYDSINGEGCVAFLPGGIGWYSKTFNTGISHSQKCLLLFDGVYNNSEYWLNGRKIGIHPSGYTPFYFDITQYLNPLGEENRLAVRVDHSRYADSRWYTGSGIYRDVQLIVTDKLHIPVWGTYITTPEISNLSAKINNQVQVNNDYPLFCKARVEVTYYNEKGQIVSSSSKDISINAGERKTIEMISHINHPQLWNTVTPVLYNAVTKIILNDNIVSKNEVKFGIRSFRFDADKGFFLNEQNMKIKGVCLHHDAGLVGAAMIKDVWKRRLQTLKEGGCNAIRLSHNPNSEEFLSLCDEMGLLVQEEFFDEWDYPKDKRLNMKETKEDYETRGYCEHFQEQGEKDLKNVMRRSRNHASIFQWSIGNEIEWTYQGCKESTGFFGVHSNGNYFWNQPPYSKEKIQKTWNQQPKNTYDIGKTAQKLAAWTREMDTTRVITANCILPSISFENGYIDALDVAGFSYRRVMYDYAKKNYPNKPIMGTENLGQWHEWKAVIDRDYVAGMFIWTGIDYLGESGSGVSKWPNKSIGCGLLDMCGFPKPSYDMMKSLWTDEAFIAIYSQTTDKSSFEVVNNDIICKKGHEWEKRLWVWDNVNAHWNYQKHDAIIVELYSNCDEIELFLNDQSLGKLYLKDFPDHIYKWNVNYIPGILTAKGKKGNKNTATSIQTAGKEHSLYIVADQMDIQANEKDIIHITAQIVDKKGNAVKHSDAEITFSITGDYRLLGVDNGDISNLSPYRRQKIKTFKGQCLLMLQATDKPSTLTVMATTPSLDSNKLIININ